MGVDRGQAMVHAAGASDHPGRPDRRLLRIVRSSRRVLPLSSRKTSDAALGRTASRTFQMVFSAAIRILSASRIRRNLLTGMLAAGGNTILTLASYPLLLRYLGFELYGVWLVLTTVLTLVQLGQFGIPQAVAKLKHRWPWCWCPLVRRSPS